MHQQGRLSPEPDRTTRDFDHGLRVYSDITQMASGVDNPTPLVRLNRIGPRGGMSIHLKMERYNPFGLGEGQDRLRDAAFAGDRWEEGR